MTIPQAIVLASLLMLMGVSLAQAHPYDEFSQKTRLFLRRDGIDLNMELAPGVLIAVELLKMLDPDEDGKFTQEDNLAFAHLVAKELTVRVDGHDLEPQIVEVNVCSLEDLITGVGTIYLKYHIPMEDVAQGERREQTIFYENRFLELITLFTLHLNDDPTQGVKTIYEERDEITQALVEVRYVVGEPIAPLAEEADSADETSEGISASLKGITVSSVPAVGDLIERLRAGVFSPDVVVLLFGLATVAGAFHAFTPGHGKTLVAAYLIANRGTPVHAVALGLLVTLTHSASIYLFGGLALMATHFFLPGNVIPVMEIASGVLIAILGVWMLFTRLYGGVADHAHVLPNLSILGKNSVNVLVDGSAADAAGLLVIAAEEPPVLDARERIGVDDINICSLGCESHNLVPSIKPERLNLPMVKHALKTGAVDALIVNKGKRQELVSRLAKKAGNRPPFTAPISLDEATALLVEAVSRFPKRGRVHIPKTELSWGNLASMGLVGGMVPCPDALAILLVAASMGQILLGMTVVFSFSIGLSLTLIGIGVLIVSSGRVLSRSPFWDRVSGIVPYVASVFITLMGLWMVARIVGSRYL